MKLLILGSAILACEPLTETADEIQSTDAIYPKHVIDGYALIDVDVPDGFTPQGYEWINGAVAAKQPVVIPPVVPESVSPRQIRQALTKAGLRDEVESAVAGADQDTKDWWEFATAFERQHPMVIAMATALGVTERQLDDLWTLAGSL